MSRRTRRRPTSTVVLALSSLLSLGLVAAPSSASAAAEVPFHLTMLRAPGFTSDSEPAVLDERTADLTARLVDGGSRLHLDLRPDGVGWSYLDFAAPDGRPLTLGHYAHTQEVGRTAPGRPGMTFVYDHGSCSDSRGEFDVRELQVDGAGTVTRLWIVYSYEACDDTPQSRFGEIRIGTSARGGLVREGQAVRWPDTYVGAPRARARCGSGRPVR